eukprot:9385811-Karenia_brevis.AAC.1
MVGTTAQVTLWVDVDKTGGDLSFISSGPDRSFDATSWAARDPLPILSSPAGIAPGFGHSVCPDTA